MGARALARGDADTKQTLIFCGAVECMIHIMQAHTHDTPMPARHQSPSSSGYAGSNHYISPSVRPRSTPGHTAGAPGQTTPGRTAGTHSQNTPGRTAGTPGNLHTSNSGITTPVPAGRDSNHSKDTNMFSGGVLYWEWGESAGAGKAGSVLEQAVACLANMACKHQPSRTAIADAGGVLCVCVCM
jgi:hypothetical protein